MEAKRKRNLFARLFTSGDGEAVLQELESFAKFSDGQFIADPRLETYMQGRRSVICEIRNTINMKVEEEDEQ